MADQPEEILDAIDRIIKDVDRKFDECLVEHFIESFDINCTKINQRSPEILDRLQFYFEHKSFLMLNQTRAFKILRTILPKSSTLHYAQEIEKLIPLLNSFWKTLDTIVLNNNASAMAVMLDIFNQVIALSDLGLDWFLEREVIPPIMLSIPIEDAASLIKYNITKFNNYHTKNKAECLMQTIIMKNSNHPRMTKFIQSLQTLILDCSSVNAIMGAMIFHPPNLVETRYKINETIEKSFMMNIDRTDIDINNLCKYLALTNLPRKIILERLRSKKKLDAIIYYISNSTRKDNQFDQLLLSYVLYPLLAKFDDEETLSLINRLMATRDEKDFVEWNMNSKTPTLCLVQLKRIMLDTLEAKLSWPVTTRTLNMIVSTLTNYIRSNYSVKSTGAQVKNMSECCHILKLILEISKPPDEKIITKIFKILHSFLVDIHQSDLTKPILLQLVNVKLSADLIYAKRLYDSRLDQVDESWQKNIELAYKFQDSEILNEFVEFFQMTTRFYYNKHHNQGNYIKLVLGHLYHHSKDTEHRELLGNLAELLLRIDLTAEETTLKEQNIKRYHDIPMIISDILEQKAAVPTTIEEIIRILSYNISQCLQYLDSLSCPEVREKFSRALALVIKSDAKESTREQSLTLLHHMIHKFIEGDRPEQVLQQLLSANILKILHEVATGGLYSPVFSLGSRREIHKIKEEVISKVDNLSDIITDEELRKFYTSPETNEGPEAKFISDFSYWDDDLKSSYVRDILNENLEKAISECY